MTSEILTYISESSEGPNISPLMPKKGMVLLQFEDTMVIDCGVSHRIVARSTKLRRTFSTPEKKSGGHDARPQEQGGLNLIMPTFSAGTESPFSMILSTAAG